MKVIFRVALTISILINLSICLGQSKESYCCSKAYDLVKIIQQHHISPSKLNDSLSTKIFDAFFRKLDPLNKYLSAEKIDELSRFRYLIDDAILSNDNSFIKETAKIWTNELEKYQHMLDQTLSQPLDISLKGYFDINPKDIYKKRRLTDFEKHRTDYLKLLLLLNYYRTNQAQLNPEAFQKFESIGRKKILEKEKEQINRILNHPNGVSDYLNEIFLSSIPAAFDPYTTYYLFDDMKDFESSLSSEGLSFGFHLDESPIGDIIISKILPSGAAWRSGKLKVGDIITSIELPSGETMNVSDFDLSEVEEFIGSNTTQTASFHFKSLDGTLGSVLLTKSKVELTENTIKSFFLKGSKKIGYIELPGFYTEWGSQKKEGCSNDVAKEIVKLKKENIEGLILDLRNNGGGSLEEALDLAGIFIDAGALTIIKQNTGDPITVKDANKGTIYDGPLLVLINGYSASASELLCAVLQDHNRAIIVGSRTFGKASCQNIFPFETSFQSSPTNEAENISSEFVKITTGKIYRLNGKSYQQIGVVPDVLLPDFTTNISNKEKNIYNSLPNDSIVKRTYYKPGPSLPVSVLSSNSNNRYLERFAVIKQYVELLHQPIPLKLNDFINYINLIKSQSDAYKKNRNKADFTASSTMFNKDLNTIDSYKGEINTAIIQELENSMYVQESFNILVDYINLQKNKP